MLKRALQIIETHASRASSFRFGIALHGLYSTSLKTIQLVQKRCEQDKIPFCMPLAQHPAENEALMYGDGPLYHLPGLLKSDDRPHVPECSAVEFARAEGLLDLNPLLIHLSSLADPVEIDIIARHKTTAVICPRSSALLEERTPPVQDLLDAEIPIMLGSNSLAVVESLDVQEDVDFLKNTAGVQVAVKDLAGLLNSN